MSNVNDKTPSHAEKEGPHNLPLARVKSIAALTECQIPMSAEALYAYAKAAELFIDDLVKSIHGRYGDNIGYDELAEFIQNCDEMEFLHDFFPRRISFEDAQKKVKAHETRH